MRKRRAVVIDGEKNVVDLFRHFFFSRGYEVFSFSSPVVCPIRCDNRQLCNTDHPCADVVITDFKMPGMNGLELLEGQSVRGCKLTRDNKALMAGQLDEESYGKIKQRGYVFFQKPIDFPKFSAWLDECERRVNLFQPLGSSKREKRHTTRCEVRCLVDCTNETVDGVTVNISDSGLCVKLAHPLTINYIIHIITQQAVIACRTASVRWVCRNPDGSYLAGLSCY